MAQLPTWLAPALATADGMHALPLRRAAVLRRLGHISQEGLVTLKGRAACEIDTADELLSSELLLNGVFSSLDLHQLPALVSTLIPQEPTRVSLPPCPLSPPTPPLPPDCFCQDRQVALMGPRADCTQGLLASTRPCTAGCCSSSAHARTVQLCA